ncbi:MAG: patatin-like phospholipase family protein [Saprospiraceae bacterium]
MSKLRERFKAIGPKRILSLDGGGIRGILTLGFLEEMEYILREKTKNPKLKLCDYFDLIGGTSTGSIIAASLAIGLSASDVKKSYFELSRSVFGKKKNLIHYLLKGEKYDPRPLDKALQDQAGNILIGDDDRIKTGLCVMTKRADTFSTWPVFNHPDGKYFHKNKDIPLWKLLRASAAAPTYFMPVELEISEGEKGVFIDGGISLVNNPSFYLLLIATLSGFPFKWKTGKDDIQLVSVGTGFKPNRFKTSDFENKGVLSWAGKLPEYFFHDANTLNQLLLQVLSDSPTAVEIDSEFGDLKSDNLFGQYALTYLRYNVTLDKETLGLLGFDLSEKQLGTIGEMDLVENMELLAKIGAAAAKVYMKEEHFSDVFL